MIIEIDGAEHFTEDGKRRDNLRTEILEEYDLTIIRFSNFDIDKNFKAVCEFIDKTVKTLIEKNS